MPQNNKNARRKLIMGAWPAIRSKGPVMLSVQIVFVKMCFDFF